ncbi:MAG: YeeE/YedE thiosulfate transporter family protein [Actinomyces sp.]|uniref:YeeE/YedE thiosulfate transporter family protein n=1 Tax=Actinomyces sp. TaxID=29317 RepID=UPI0026DC06FF|nr:YeeE/YedE thiosulfate transporter family protein [Actinomyces sp.]MDO4244376.1 YeeE/YedE thiosulfate transporter family protein [Actinomyces sp.]
MEGLWTTGLTTIPITIGLPQWAGVLLVVGVTAALVRRERRRAAQHPVGIQLPAQRTGLAHLLFERAWNPLVTGALVGVVAVIAWPASWGGRQRLHGHQVLPNRHGLVVDHRAQVVHR